MGLPCVPHSPAYPHPHQRQGAQVEEQAVRDGRVLTKALFFIYTYIIKLLYHDILTYITRLFTLLYHIYHHIIYIIIYLYLRHFFAAHNRWNSGW